MELKLCPFCGNSFNQGHKSSCYFRVRGKGSELREASWQSRPLEDDLLNKLHKAEERYIFLQKKIIDLSNHLELAKEALKRIEFYANSDWSHTQIAREALKKLEDN